MKIIDKGSLFVGLILLYAFVTVQFAMGQTARTSPKNNGLEINPAYSDITVTKQDAQRSVTLTYTNNSDTAITLNLSLYNYNAEDQGVGNTVFDKDASNNATSLLPYTTIDPTTLPIAPHSVATATVTIRNGAELSPGGHYAAVVAEINPDKATTTSPQVAPSVSSLIFLNKQGGEKYGLSFNGVEEKFPFITFSYPSLLHLQFHNSGNVHLIVYGTVEEKDMVGRLIYKGVVNTSSLILFPKTTRSLTVQLNKTNFSYPFSLNTITIKGDDSLHKVEYSYNKKIIYVNIVAVAIVVAAISLLILSLRRFKRDKK